jgi:flagellar hook-length control protein FliK
MLEGIARDQKPLEITVRAESSFKAETFSTLLSSQTTSSGPLSGSLFSSAAQPLHSVDAKILAGSGVVAQSDNQPSMTLRLKEFQDLPNAMGERLAWLASRDQKTAVIRLDPPELGKLELLLNVDGDKVSVNVQTSGNAVRDLLLQQLEKLRHAMAEHNLNLVDVNVSTGKESNQQRDDLHPSIPSSVSNFMVDESTDEIGDFSSSTPMVMKSGLLDTFA